MKRRFALLLAAVLLCGCAKKAPAAETDAPETVTSVPRATASLQEREKTRMSVFRETVENLAYESRLPDGSTVPQGTDSASMDGNFFALADVNGDGAVNSTDAALIYRKANGKMSNFPAES